MNKKNLVTSLWFNPQLKLYPIDEVNYWQLDGPEGRVLPWVARKGEDSLRLDYLLTEESLVYDIGGYYGEWAKDISTRYKCRIKVYEPVSEYIDIINKHLEGAPQIEVFPYGLGGKTRKEKIGVDGLASSVFKAGDSTLEIAIKDISKELEKEKVDLMKMNIEGGEYELLEKLIETGQVKNIRTFQIQFHDFVPGAKARRRKIQKILARTHTMTYNYPLVWENWERNA